MRRARWVAAALTAATLSAAAAAVGPGQSEPSDPPAGDGRLVLVSGHDDHGLLAQPTVDLVDAVESARVVGRVADGTFAKVTDSHGEWLRITTTEGVAVSGWVNDYYLRGVLHVSGPRPDCRSTVGGRRLPAGEQAVVLEITDSQVRIRTLRDPVTDGWVGRRYLAELPPRTRTCQPGPDASAQVPHHH